MDNPSSPRIAAVFATMNRAETAVSCVQALAAQSRPPEWVIVADNASTDRTVETLRGLHRLPFQLVVLDLAENLGNAGGVKEAMEHGYALGADAVWILDDDSWPHPGALAAMLAKPWDPTVVRHPLQIDPRTGCFTWPLQVADGHGGWRLADSLEELPPGEFIRTRITWTGALVSHEVREKAGPVMGELFIRGEDEEYPWRIEQAGFTQEAARYAILDHPGPANLVRWSFFGKHFFFEQGLAEWKLHYKVRNMVWLKRRQSGTFHALAMTAVYAIATALLDGPARIGVVLSAAREGYRMQCR